MKSQPQQPLFTRKQDLTTDIQYDDRTRHLRINIEAIDPASLFHYYRLNSSRKTRKKDRCNKVQIGECIDSTNACGSVNCINSVTATSATTACKQ